MSMGHSSLWELSDCCDPNEHHGGLCIKQSGETEAGGSVTLWLLPPFPYPVPATVSVLGEGSGAPGLCFLELTAAITVL